MWRRLVLAELHDQLGEVGLVGGDAGRLERLVQADLLGGHRLDLDHLVGAGRLHEPGDDGVGLVGVAGPVHRAAAGGDLLLERDQVLVEPGHRGGLDRPAGLAQLRPVGHLADDGGPLAADGRRRVPEVGAQLAVAQRVTGGVGEGAVAPQVPDARGSGGDAEEDRGHG